MTAGAKGLLSGRRGRRPRHRPVTCRRKALLRTIAPPRKPLMPARCARSISRLWSAGAKARPCGRRSRPQVWSSSIRRAPPRCRWPPRRSTAPCSAHERRPCRQSRKPLAFDVSPERADHYYMALSRRAMTAPCSASVTINALGHADRSSSSGSRAGRPEPVDDAALGIDDNDLALSEHGPHGEARSRSGPCRRGQWGHRFRSRGADPPRAGRRIPAADHEALPVGLGDDLADLRKQGQSMAK